MSSMTKLELSQRLSAALAEAERLRVRVAELEGDVEALNNKVRKALEVPRNVKPENVVSEWTDTQGQKWQRVRVGWNRCAVRAVQ